MSTLKNFKNFISKNFPFLLFIFFAIVFLIVWNCNLGKTVNVIVLLFVLLSEAYYVKESLLDNKDLSEKIGSLGSVAITALFWIAYLASTNGEILITVAILVLLVFGTIAQLLLQSWFKFISSNSISKLIVSYVMLSFIFILAFGAMYIWFDSNSTPSLNQMDYLFFSAENYYSSSISIYSPTGFYVQIIQVIETMWSFLLHTIIVAVVLDIVLKKKSVTK